MNDFTSQRLSSEQLRAELKKITGSVSGFYRLSDAEEAVMLHDEALSGSIATAVPFLFEAAFFDGKVSIGIRQYNDFWLFNRVEWDGAPPRKPQSGDDFFVYRQYTKSREGMLFYTQYLPVAKYGFEVMTPTWNMFVGFDKEA